MSVFIVASQLTWWATFAIIKRTNIKSPKSSGARHLNYFRDRSWQEVVSHHYHHPPPTKIHAPVPIDCLTLHVHINPPLGLVQMCLICPLDVGKGGPSCELGRDDEGWTWVFVWMKAIRPVKSRDQKSISPWLWLDVIRNYNDFWSVCASLLSVLFNRTGH